MGGTGEGLKRARPQHNSISDLYPEDTDTGLSVVVKKARLEDGDGAPNSEADSDKIDARVRAHDVDAKTGSADPDEGHDRIGIDGANNGGDDKDVVDDDDDDVNHNKDGDDALLNGDKVHRKLDIRGGRDTNTGRRKPPKQATIGPRHFDSSKEMLDYFYHLLNGWPLVLNINKYEHLMLEDLLKRGHKEAKRKIGVGIQAFQVRLNRDFEPHCRCFYIIRTDGSVEDFSYRKCVDNILPLPNNLKANVSGTRKHHKRKQSDRAGKGRQFGGGERGWDHGGGQRQGGTGVRGCRKDRGGHK